MIKTNCELPNTLLEYNNELNDYDFVLFHLYKKDKTYREYYKSQRKKHPNRFMILDNSAYEFFINGEELNIDEFYKTICELQPNYYILPDVLMDKTETISRTKEFIEKYEDFIRHNSPNSKSMAVLQGNSEKDFDDCMSIYKSMGIWAIAIPFHNSFFKERLPNFMIGADFSTYYSPNEDVRYALGRVDYILSNYDKKLSQFKHIHILGSHCPFEKKYYSTLNTMDTGYPVKLGINNEILLHENTKPNIIIDDFLNDDLNQSIREKIIINVMKFKGF